MGGLAVAEVVTLYAETDETALRAEFAERIKSVWHRSRAEILALGRALIEARQKLAHGTFTAMVENDLPFSPWTARQFMRVASDPRLADCSTCNVLPEAVRVMDEITKLDDNQFEAAIASGSIRPDMTVKEAQSLVRDLNRQRAAAYVHRPLSNKCPPPTRPAAAGARNYSELVYLLIEWRKSKGVSQAALDDIIGGWGEGQTSKYEIPHQDDGRIASWDKMAEWLQGLGLGITLVPLR